MSDSNERATGRNVIGGRHGSPSITIAWPFAKITNVDSELRDAVSDLADLVARLAAASSSGDEQEAGRVREAAQELSDRLVGHAG